MEKVIQPSLEKEKPRKKIFTWMKRILGAGAIAGGLVVADQVWDHYNETQEHKDREEKRKRNIAITKEELEKSTESFFLFENSPEFKKIADSDPEIIKSLDSLESLLSALEEEKKTGTVSQETLTRITTITETLKNDADSLNSPEKEEVLSVLSSISDNVAEFSKIEKAKELTGYIDSFLGVINNKDLIKSISEHPGAISRMAESIEKYKGIFAEYIVDQESMSVETKAAVDSLFPHRFYETDRLLYALVAMQQDGVINDFYESLGSKINIAMIAAHFDGKISLSKNLPEATAAKIAEMMKEDPEFMSGFEKDIGRSSNQKEVEDIFIASLVYYDGSDFFDLFSVDNAEEINNLIKDINRKKDLSDEDKENILTTIQTFGDNIRNFMIQLENAEKK